MTSDHRCTGKTKTGEQCKKIALVDDECCYYHTKKATGRNRGASPKPISAEELEEIREFYQRNPDMLPRAEG